MKSVPQATFRPEITAIYVGRIGRDGTFSFPLLAPPISAGQGSVRVGNTYRLPLSLKQA